MNWKSLSRGILTVCVALTVIVAPGCRGKDLAVLTIAVAANMQYAADALIDDFSAKHGIACEKVIGSSGKLTAQIMEGAPFDVFLSADMHYPEVLYQKEMTDGAPRVYAYGSLVLWTASDNLIPSIDMMLRDDVQHIALANPRIAPYGTAAVEVLNHYGILEDVRQKLVYGESIAQTNQFIMSGAAEVGLTAQSAVLADAVKNTGAWKAIDTAAYTQIAQGVVALNNSSKPFQARMFRDFLFAAEGRKILQDYGYLTK